MADRIRVAGLHLKAGRYAKAIAELEKVLQVKPGNPFALYYLAKAYEGGGDLDIASSLLEGVHYYRLGQDWVPELAPVLLGEAVWKLSDAMKMVSLLMWQGAWDDAERAIWSVMEMRPDEGDLYYSQAQVCLQTGRWEEATKALKKSIELNPQHMASYFKLGRAYEGLKDLDQAAAWYERYLQLAPEDLMGLKRLAQIYRHLGRNTEARTLEERLSAQGRMRRE